MSKPKVNSTNFSFKKSSEKIKTEKDRVENIVSVEIIQKIFNDQLKSDDKLNKSLTKQQDDIYKKYLIDIVEDMKYFRSNIESKKKYEKILLKWHFSAMVIDRFCFILSFTYLIVTFIAFILTMKNFYRMK